MPNQTKLTSECPECGAQLELPSDVEAHEIVVCDDCGIELEITQVVPTIQLYPAPEEEEDWGE